MCGVSKKKWPILFNNLLYKMGHYVMNTQYEIKGE